MYAEKCLLARIFQDTDHESKQQHQRIHFPDPAAQAGGDQDHVGRARVGECRCAAGGDQPAPAAGHGRAGGDRFHREELLTLCVIA